MRQLTEACPRPETPASEPWAAMAPRRRWPPMPRGGVVGHGEGMERWVGHMESLGEEQAVVGGHEAEVGRGRKEEEEVDGGHIVEQDHLLSSMVPGLGLCMVKRVGWGCTLNLGQRWKQSVIAAMTVGRTWLLYKQTSHCKLHSKVEMVTREAAVGRW